MIKLSTLNIPNDIPKYKKKSNHTNKKSDHKHNYLPCYINYSYIIPNTNHVASKYLLSTYCTICGQIGDILFLTFSTDNKIKKKYNLSETDLNKLPRFIVDNIYKDKYVDLNQLRKKSD